ncbi:MAG: phosphate ABC transporter ATP-binding protein PstB [Candidatus Bathyarchaeota archaeon]|nr:phosphate ABC transporter ATP-binding protein PstB [Candidatus Bathyarchaeota archaeon]
MPSEDHQIDLNKNDKISFRKFNLWYGEKQALKDINIDIKNNILTAIMGPSGCGKSSLLRSINRINDLIPDCRTSGEVLIDRVNIYGGQVDVYDLRRRVGMVFQKSNPFPKSIYENIAYGPRIHGIIDQTELDRVVEKSLRGAALWDEVKDRLKDNAYSLSGGQQQRLCIARALSIEPEVILMDEPCSALDPIATSKIEALMRQLKEVYTVVLVTHNLQQAARVSDMTAFMYIGELIEFGNTLDIFEDPQKELTEKYITGKFG